MSLRSRLHELVFTAKTWPARVFDAVVLSLIAASITSVVVGTVDDIGTRYSTLLEAIEWTVTIAFTVEYALRVYCSADRRRYVLSFLGIIDFVSVLPTYLSLFSLPGHAFLVLRGLRLIRMFRVLGLGRWAEHGAVIEAAVRQSVPKITVFLVAILMVTVILGTLVYFVEGQVAPFHNIPVGMYWALSTLTTVGYGDVVPQSPWGRVFASITMVLGYGVIAVPIGIVSSDVAATVEAHRNRRICPNCDELKHAADSQCCRMCGTPLPEPERTRAASM